MKYLFVVFLTAGIISCQSPSEELIKENEALRVQAMEFRQMAENAAASATQARAEAVIALEDARIAQATAQEMARLAQLAQAESERQKAAFEKCKSGK